MQFHHKQPRSKEKARASCPKGFCLFALTSGVCPQSSHHTGAGGQACTTSNKFLSKSELSCCRSRCTLTNAFVVVGNAVLKSEGGHVAQWQVDKRCLSSGGRGRQRQINSSRLPRFVERWHAQQQNAQKRVEVNGVDVQPRPGVLRWTSTKSVAGWGKTFQQEKSHPS